jgi:hypothetical protein
MATITIDGVRRDVVVKRDGQDHVVVGRTHAARREARRRPAFMVDRASHVARRVEAASLSMGGRTYAGCAKQPTDRPGGRRVVATAGLKPRCRVDYRRPRFEGDRAHGQAWSLESTKMHNEITTPHDGVVRSQLVASKWVSVSAGRNRIEIS